MDLLEDVLTRAFLLCRQLALLLECFVQYGAFKQATHFGTYRVELAVSLYSRLLDIHNFELVVSEYPPTSSSLPHSITLPCLLRSWRSSRPTRLPA